MRLWPLETPPYDAVKVPLLSVDTARVVTVKLVLIAPAGTITLDGLLTPTVVAAIETFAPEEGAAPVSVTLAVAVWHEPMMVLRVSESTLSAGGTTVRVREIVTSP
jgi:hypothetical protein